MKITPEEIARLRASHARISGASVGSGAAIYVLDEVPRLLDEIERLRADRDSSLACKVDSDIDTLAKESGRSFRDVAILALAHQARRIEVVEADLREAMALLCDVDEFANPVDSWRRRDALLAKHKEDS